jgi:hypothetical protein
VNFFSQFGESVELTKTRIGAVPIGIYGSFEPKNIKYLSSMRDFLRANGYLAFISTDIREFCPKPDNVSVDMYNLKISEFMTVINQIHMVFIFQEDEGEHNINQSASIELDILTSSEECHVAIFHEEGSMVQSRSLFRGLLDQNIESWAIYPFVRQEDKKGTMINDLIFRTGLSFCYNRIVSDPSLGFCSIEAFERKVARLWPDFVRGRIR